MPLDTRLPLMGNQLEVQQVQNNRLAQLAQQDIQKKRLAMDEQAQGQQMQVNEEQMVQQRLNNLDAREKSRFTSTVLGAAQLVPYLEDNDVAGAEAFLMTRKRNLQNRIAAGENIDTTETDAALKQLKENPQALKQSLGKLLQVGKMAGVLDTQKAEGFTLKPNETRFDAQGNVLAAAPAQTGMVPSTDPVTGEVTYGPTRKLSATDQKEIYEASDGIQSGSAAVSALKKAKTIMDGGVTGNEEKPYSGFGAGLRADAARLPVIGDVIADKERGAATTEYSSLVNEQALNNMKAIFGGNPTEGERQVLLKMQAIADYTPEEQSRIIDNAIAAAERRINFNQGKIKSVQSGDYGALGQAPGQTQKPKGIEAEETKVIGGVEYHKINGKWVTQ